MDIALRKDLIEIQELIANPPPVRSGKQARALLKKDQLEGHATGQLYGKLTINNGRPANRNGHRHHLRHATRRPSSEDEEQHLGDFGLARLTVNDRCNKTKQRPSRRNWTAELAVDVPNDEGDLQCLGADDDDDENGSEPRLVNRANRFSSLHSLSASAQKQQKQLQPQPKQHQQPLRRLRTKTLAAGSGADLHLLPALMSRRSNLLGRLNETAGAGRAASNVELSSGCRPGDKPATTTTTTTTENCLPADARDETDEWADMMAESGLSAVIEANSASLANRKRHQFSRNSVKKSRIQLIKSSSPVGSMRSSLSKSHRGLVRQRRRGCSLLVRRPKLSLLRLRYLASKRTAGANNGQANNAGGGLAGNLRLAVSEAHKNEPGQATATPDNVPGKQTSNSNSNSCQADLEAARQRLAANQDHESANEDGSANITTITAGGSPADQHAKQQRPVAAGRRQERLERSGGAPIRAPNGTPLLSTRPLAALNDDTQLYAIPKKSKVSLVKEIEETKNLFV